MRFPRTIHCSLLLAVALGPFACGGQTGEVAPEFCDGPVTWSGLTDETPTGFDAEEVLGTFPTTSTESFAWEDGAQTSITLVVEYDSDIQNEGMIALVDASGSQCVPRLEIPVTLTITTADGLLSESIVEYIRAEDPSSASLQADLYVSDLAGSIDIESMVPANSWDPNSARLFFAIDLGAGASGTLTLDTHQEGGEASHTVIGSW